MSDIVLRVEDLWKQYRLGEVGTGSLREDFNHWWAKVRGKESPNLKIGETNNRNTITGDYVWALQDINFEVKQGEVLGIIGKNGAGKSTLLKILSKVTGPSKGRITTKGRIASLLEVGTGFHPELSGRDNIFLNGAILGMSKSEIRSKFDEIVDFSGIGKYIDTPVKKYSSGMYVRLAFAVAAHLEPEILIIDEVLAVGDAEFQKKCLGKMKDVAGEGRTVLFVSHNMVAVQQLCQNGLLLDFGKIEIRDSISKCINYYHEIGVKRKTSTNISLSDRLNRTSGQVRFSDIQAFGDDNYPKWIFRHDEVIKMHFKIEVFENVSNLLFYMALKDSFTTEIITNAFHVIETDVLNIGKKINFIIQIREEILRPHQYDMYFALGNVSKSIWYDVVDHNVSLPSLHITPTNKDPDNNIGFFGINTSLIRA